MDQFIGEIRIFAGTFPPKGWALCNGQILAISQNTPLFAVIGTTYGGNGTSTFQLPNLQGRAPMHSGQGNGLTERVRGEAGGAETVALSSSQIPGHSHTVQVSSAVGTETSPTGNFLAASAVRSVGYDYAANTLMHGSSLGAAQAATAHNNMQPYLTLNFIIALQGEFPARP